MIDPPPRLSDSTDPRVVTPAPSCPTDEETGDTSKKPACDERLYCPGCDYNLSGLPSDRCPACGLELSPETLLEMTDGSRARRFMTAGASLTIAIGATVSTWILVSRGQHLTLFDALAVLAVAAAVAGHLTLALQAALPRTGWPRTWDEVATILTFLGIASILAGLMGASQALSFEPSPLYNEEGVKVNGFFEFVLLAGLIGLPGAFLLILTLFSYRVRPLTTHSSRQPSPPGSFSDGTSSAPWRIIVNARLQKSAVSQSWDNTPRPTDANIERMIAQSWEAELALATQQSRPLYNGKLARLQQYELSREPTRLHLVLGPTCYRDFLATNLLNSPLADTHGLQYLSNAVGVSVLPVTSDGWVALGVRSTRVAFHAGRMHPLGGMVEKLCDQSIGEYDVFHNAKRELIEELGIDSTQIKSMTLMGLLEDTGIRQPELVFEADLALSHDGLKKMFEANSANQEHQACHQSPATPDGLAKLLTAVSSLTPIAQGTILLFGRHRWGSLWFEKTCTQLYRPAGRNLVRME